MTGAEAGGFAVDGVETDGIGADEAEDGKTDGSVFTVFGTTSEAAAAIFPQKRQYTAISRFSLPQKMQFIVAISYSFASSIYTINKYSFPYKYIFPAGLGSFISRSASALSLSALSFISNAL
jgi:hypothetical protein